MLRPGFLWHLGRVLALLWLVACTPQDIEPASGTARFPAYPEGLFDAVRAMCTEPIRTFRPLSRNSVECRGLMSPENTAAAITQYDGSLDDLPRLAIRFDAEPREGGYVVAGQTYLVVPQRTGPERVVPVQSQRILRSMDRLLMRAGGTSIPADGSPF